MILFALPMYSQEIFLDKTDPDGVRSITTTRKMIIVFGKGGIAYSLTNHVQPSGDEQYYINIGLESGHNFKIPENGLLLMRTSNGDVIECKQLLEDYQTEDPIGTYSTITRTTTHHISGVYPISLGNLEKIAEQGLIKVRIDTSEGYREVNYKEKNKKRTQEYFYKSLENINLAKNQSSDIREGF